MVIDSTNIKDTRELFSQTPPDFVEENYYLNSLQMKVDADWEFRPNRKWVEEEQGPGTEEYEPLEVVIQTIKSDKGQAISDDYYRLVFRDCQKQVRIGTRYRFAYSPNKNIPDVQKNIWLAINQTQLTPTASQAVVRCNGTLGSLYIDKNNNTIRHYEPIVQPDKLSDTTIRQNEVATDLNGAKVIIAQFNKYTQQYFINQRFFIDANAFESRHQPIYKITNIVRSNTLTTYDPTDVGLVKIYYELDQIGAKDDIINRIAYNGPMEYQESPSSDVPIDGSIDVNDHYTFMIEQPTPESLTSFTFRPQLKNNGINVPADVACVCELIGAYYADKVPLENYIEYTDNEDGTFTIARKKKDSTLRVKVTCYVTAPNGSAFQVDFTTKLI